MCRQITIKPGIVIDEAENVEIAIRNLCGKDASTDVIKKFIENETGTMYYIDNKLNSSSSDDGNKEFLWLDTGYVSNGSPVMIALKRGYDGFSGHYTATVKEHMEFLRNRYYSNRKVINSNYSRFTDKLNKNTEQRKHEHITDKNEYIMSSLAGEVEETELAKKIRMLNLSFEDNSYEVAEEIIEDNQEEPVFEKFSPIQESITIDLLMDKIEELENYAESLLKIIEDNKSQSTDAIAELKKKNGELQTSILQMRGFFTEELKRSGAAGDEQSEINGHEMLGHKKILVIGDSDLSEGIMTGIAKDFGFEKKDFVFETDYAKVKSFGNRLNRSERYQAVIVGKIPHSIALKGDFTNPVTMIKENFGCQVEDGRTKSGELKVTKTSYKEALSRIITSLRVSA